MNGFKLTNTLIKCTFTAASKTLPYIAELTEKFQSKNEIWKQISFTRFIDLGSSTDQSVSCISVFGATGLFCR